jgi:hypothetical protein
MPPRHKANPMVCGELNAGSWGLILAVPSRRRLWLDSVALRGVRGGTDTRGMTPGGLSGHGPSSPFPNHLPQKGAKVG